MKNRVLALIVAVMMLLSAFILAGCNSDSGEESTKELTAKELFEVSLKNSSVPESNFVSYSDIKGEMKFDLTVDKFVLGGTDVTALGNISLTGTGLVNGAENVQAAFELSAFGEKVPFECLTKNDNYFIVDFLGLNDKAIKLDVEQAMSDAQGANAVLMNAGSFYEIIEYVANSAKTVLDSNLDDSAFSMSEKDVTVLGQTFTGAKVIVLTLGKEQTDKIASELIDELLKNEDIKKMFGEDFNKEEALKELEDFKSMQIVNTVVDEKSIALSMYLEGMFEVAKDESEDAVADASDVSDVSETSEVSEEEAEKAERTLGIITEYVGKNFSLDMGYTNEGKVDASIEGELKVDYKEESDKFDFSFKITEDGDEVELVSAKGDIIDGEYDGILSLNTDNSKLEVEFYCSSKENESEFGITKIKTIGAAVEGGDEVETTLPIEFSLKYKYEENKVTTDGKLNVDIEGMTKIDVSLNAVTELKDVTIDPISSFDDINQLDMNAAMTQAAAKYPKTFAFINGIISSFGGSDDDSYYEKDGLGLWLTEDFEEVDNDNFTAVYYGSDSFVFTYKDSYDKFVGYGDFDFEDYVNAIYVDFVMENPTEVNVDSYGIPYFEYTTEGFRYYVAMYEGYDGYWMVMFGCNESIYEANRPLFVNWAAYADPFASAPVATTNA